MRRRTEKRRKRLSGTMVLELIGSKGKVLRHEEFIIKEEKCKVENRLLDVVLSTKGGKIR